MSVHIGQAIVACAALECFAAVVAPTAHGQSPTRIAPDSLRVARPAPEPVGALTLEQALDLAAAHHPGLRSAAWRLRAATDRRTDAGRLANPTVAVDLENLGGDLEGDRQELTATLGQTLELGGDRRARADAAQAAERLAWWDLSAEERASLSQVTERFIETWTLQERVDRLADAERLAERSITVAAERFRAGAGPALEQTRAEVVLALRRAERIRAAADLTASWQRLVASWGSAEVRFDSLQLATPRRESIPPPARLYTLLEAHPLQARAVAEVALEEARLREAHASRVPDLSLTGGVRRLGDDATTFVVGASIPLPLWNRQAGSTAASEAEREAMAAQARLVALDLRAALRNAYERYIAAHESYDLIASQVRPKSEEVLRQLIAGYRSGRFSSLEFLEGQRSLLDAELQVIDATAEAWRAEQALERLLGRSIEELGQEQDR